jgi:carbamoyltransferase
MKILGINGWKDWFHDSSACLIIDGQLSAFVEEERFTRIKHAPLTVPVFAAQWCLQSGGINWEDLDCIAVGWNLLYFGELVTPKMGADDFAKKLLVDLHAPKSFPLEKIIFLDHHLAHAHSGIVLEPFRQSLVLVVDGQGEKKSISIFRHTIDRLQKLAEFDARYSLGYYYEAATSYVGFGLKGTGKFMGLSSYGKPVIDYWNSSNTKELLSPAAFEQIGIDHENLDDATSIVDSFWIPRFKDSFPLPQIVKATTKAHQEVDFDKRDKLHLYPDAVDFSASVQQSLEKVMEFLVCTYLSSKDEAIIIAGGVGLNCKNNGFLARRFPNQKIVVQPLSHDAGVALGAASCVAKQKGFNQIKLGTFPYVGPSFTNEEIEKVLQSQNIHFQYLEKPELVAAQHLAHDKVIGWFQGKAEVGPRALGARSILARPDSVKVRDRVNQKIKLRERWRPFSPVVLEEFSQLYFENCKESLFMLFGFPIVSDESKKLFAGTIHVDNTSRVQTIHEGKTPKIFLELVREFYSLTGVPGLMNTSFNGHKEPIVNTPKDAINTFLEVGLDALYIGNYVVYSGNLDS